MTQKLTLQWLPCQAPGVTGSALGLVGPVSVYCDWVSNKLKLNDEKTEAMLVGSRQAINLTDAESIQIGGNC